MNLGSCEQVNRQKSTCVDKFLNCLIAKFQKDINPQDSEIEKEMKTRRNILKVFQIAIFFLFLGLVLKVLGIWL